jgi:alpha-tubulin suppressor-like RCC1 family protein
MSLSADHLLLSAAKNGDFALCETLVVSPDAGGVAARLEFRDRANGFTALHYAAMNGHLSCVSMLLQLGANPTAGTNRVMDEVTPLHLAASGGYGEIVTLLVHYGADTQTSDLNGSTARDHAAAMAESLSAVPAMRRRDCEMILRVQESKDEWAGERPEPRRIIESDNADMNPELSRIVAMSVGGSERLDADCALFLSLRGSVLTWGNNGDSQLGSMGDKKNATSLLAGHFHELRLVPALRRDNVRCEQVSAGVRHSIVLLSSGYAATTGEGFNGQLGLGEDMMRSNQYCPVYFPMMCKVTSVAAGLFHSMFSVADGRVFAMGSNRKGQLGCGDRHDRMLPEPVKLPRKVTQPGIVKYVVCGELHSVLVCQRPVAAGAGIKKKSKDRNGQTIVSNGGANNDDDDDDDDDDDSVDVGTGFGNDAKFDAFSCGIKISTGHAKSSDDLTMRPIQGLDVAIISCGAKHSVCISPNGTVCTWGSGRCGQLGHGDRSDQHRPKLIGFFIEGKAARVSRLVAAAAGGRHTILLSDTGELFGMGSNSYGQLGMGDRRESLLPKQLHIRVPGKTDHMWKRQNCIGRALDGSEDADHVPHPVLIAAGGCCSFVCTQRGEVMHFGSQTRDHLRRMDEPDHLFATPLPLPDDDDDTPVEKRRKLRLKILAVEARAKKAPGR